jgi:hypothetical protein
MAHYLVRAKPKTEFLAELEKRLQAKEFMRVLPFGLALSESLCNARLNPDGTAVWEEEDYCKPPLAMEREAILDFYFEGLKVEYVKPGMGWHRIKDRPPLFPTLVWRDGSLMSAEPSDE